MVLNENLFFQEVSSIPNKILEFSLNNNETS
jgi:hypothetical protein